VLLLLFLKKVFDIIYLSPEIGYLVHITVETCSALHVVTHLTVVNIMLLPCHRKEPCICFHN